MNRQYEMRVPETYSGRRADEVLHAVLGISRRQLGVVKREKGLYLDGQPIYVNAIVAAGQRLTLCFAEPYDQGVLPEEGAVESVYEDDCLQVLCKPAPLAVTPTPEKPLGTLANRMKALHREEDYIFRPVNRLDKGTSGLMVVAKDPLTQKKLLEIIHTEDFVREYVAVVEGMVVQDAVTIDAPIGKAEGETNRRCVRPDGKRSVTKVEVLARDEARNRTLLRLRLLTGRTHQLRVHLSFIGHPIVGDEIYDTAHPALPGRIALHCFFMRLKHPKTGENLEFIAKMPAVFDTLLTQQTNF